VAWELRAAVVVVCLCLFGLAGCAPRTASTRQEPKSAADAGSSASVRPAATIGEWTAEYPAEAAAWQSATQMEKSPSGYGGSLPLEKSESQPEMKVNYKGSGFGASYKTVRGHPYSWEDLSTTARITDKTPGSCITCKTPAVADLYGKNGWNFAQQPARSLIAQGHPPINCFSCHDPGTGALRPSVPSYAEAVARRGTKAAAGRKDAGDAICAQCHSTYYLEPGTNRVVSPWDKGLEPEAMLAYYATEPSGFRQDFVQPDSGVPVLKARHPDYELFAGSVHSAAGISCVDCHMPWVAAGGKNIRDHHIRSPLLDLKASCLGCHRGKTEDWMRSRVRYIQDSVFQAQRLAGQRVAEAHGALAAAARRGASVERLADARALLREGQWYWDYVASANSMGFHNPVLALRTLSKSIDLAARAEAVVSR
jgi:nitrite reductase (cytochrome c-552)